MVGPRYKFLKERRKEKCAKMKKIKEDFAIKIKYPD